MAQISSQPISEPDVPQPHYYDSQTLLFMQVTLYLSATNKILRTTHDSYPLDFCNSFFVRTSVHATHNDLRLHTQCSSSLKVVQI